MTKKNNKIWKVYVHTNKTNGKTYVGLTKKNVEARWQEGLGYRTQVFFRAIQKYGWDGFRHDVVAENLTEDEARSLEHDLIILLKSRYSDHGYNVAEGGIYSGGYGESVCQFDCYGNFIAEYDSIAEAARYTNIKEYCIGACVRQQSRYTGGYIWRYKKDCVDLKSVKKEIMSDSRIVLLFPIYQFSYDGCFIKEYANACAVTRAGFKSTSIIKCCQGELVHSQGYCWAFKKDVDNIEKFKPREKKTNRWRTKTVVQLDFDGNVIAEYDSSEEAAVKTELTTHNILQCCEGRKKSHGGYQWIYKKDLKDIKQIYQRERPANCITVQQIDSNGQIVNVFYSIAEASRITGISEKIISTLISKGTKYNGYYWKKEIA